MSLKIVQARLNSYHPKNQLEEENALKEITQEIALSGLSRAGFFKIAAFQGGTSLRILHGLGRFSEDLDFALNQPDHAFDWSPYLKSLQTELEAYGYRLEIRDRSDRKNTVKAAFLKDDSIGKFLLLNHRDASTSRSIKIKLEIDTAPPQAAATEQKYIEFPVTVPVLTHDLPSLFAGKSHALLCRTWEKGRDWYDFSWYVGRKAKPNFKMLTHALHQLGPWKNQGIEANQTWYLKQLRAKIKATDWEKQKKDVDRFLKASDLDLLGQWSTAFFLDRVKVMEKYL